MGYFHLLMPLGGAENLGMNDRHLLPWDLNSESVNWG